MEGRLAERLLERVRAAGQMTFRDFMESALYDPQDGFYGAGRVRLGRGGDFTTSSGLHRLFGELVGDWALARWRALGEPASLTVLESGPGTGRLARDIAERVASSARRPRQLHLLLDERSAALRRRQQRMLAGLEADVEWIELARNPPAPFEGVVVANELLDALPVHPVRVRGGLLEELYVVERDGRLAASWGPPSTPALAAALGSALCEGDETELCVDASDWLERSARALARGAILVIDYARRSQAAGLGPRRSTLRALRARRASPDPLASPGEQDITADVDFERLLEAARGLGLATAPLRSQRAFLTSLGLVERAAAATSVSGAAAVEELLALKQLVMPGGIGDAMTVLELTRS